MTPVERFRRAFAMVFLAGDEPRGPAARRHRAVLGGARDDRPSHGQAPPDAAGTGTRARRGDLADAVHGRHSTWVKNVEARSGVRIRIRIRGRWRVGTAAVVPWDESVARGFNRYARLGPRTLGIDPALVRVDLWRAGDLGSTERLAERPPL